MATQSVDEIRGLEHCYASLEALCADFSDAETILGFEATVGEGSGGDQQIDGPGATCLAARRDDCGIHAPIGPRRVAIERQGIKGGFGSL